MKKTHATVITLIVFLIALSTDRPRCQTISLDNINISIGDSLEYVMKKFSVPPYRFITDTSRDHLRYSVYKEIGTYSDNTEIPVQLLGRMYFVYFPANNPDHFTKTLFMVEKVWNSYAKEPINILKTFSDILEKNNIDKYSLELSLSKNIEPDFVSNTIEVRINSFTTLEIYYRDDDYYEISEVITKNNNLFSDKEYILIFEDTKHFWGGENHIIEYFKSEEDAERRSRELKIPYLVNYENLPNVKIIRFFKRPD